MALETLLRPESSLEAARKEDVVEKQRLLMYQSLFGEGGSELTEIGQLASRREWRYSPPSAVGEASSLLNSIVTESASLF